MSQNTLNSRTGPVYTADGVTSQDVRHGRWGELIIQSGGGKYKEAVRRGNCYSGCTAQTGVAPGTALGTTAAHCLYNPVGSGKIFIVQEIGMGLISGTLGAGVVNITSDSVGAGAAVPTGTAITPRNRLIGSANTSSATYLTTATITTNAAKVIGVFCSLTQHVVATTAVNNEMIVRDMDGSICIGAGGYITLHATAAAGSSPLVVFSICWEEETV